MTSERRNCAVCRAPVPKGAACLVDNVARFRDDHGSDPVRARFVHLACAPRSRLRTALLAADRELLGELLVEVAKLDPELAGELAPEVPPVRKTAPLADSEALLAELEAAPDDRDLLAVLADQLLQRGDDRGELIMLGLSGRWSPRRGELLQILEPRRQGRDVLSWGIGFLREVRLILDGHTLESRGPILAHPSCRLLHTLAVWPGPSTETFDVPPAILPRALRVLDIQGTLRSAELSRLPYLEEIRVERCEAVSHPTCTRLTLRVADLATLAACARGLPGVATMTLAPSPILVPNNLDEMLESTGWLARLRELILEGIEPTRRLRIRAAEAGVALVER